MNGGVRRVLIIASLCLTALPAGAAHAGGGCHSGGRPDAGRAVTGTEVQMTRICFEPPVLAVQPGTTVRFTNQDEVVHVVAGTGWGSTDELAAGQWMEHRFLRPGIYPYTCYLHPGMNGAVVVGEAGPASTPAAAATPASAPAPPVEVAATSTSTAGGRSALPLLGVGGVTGAVVGSVVTRRRRSTAH